MSTSVRFDSVSHRFGDHQVFHRFDLQAEAGEVIRIFGASGSGKSTLMRLASGLLVPQSGRIERRANLVAMAFQQPRLLPWRTAKQNIIIPLLNHGISLPEASSRADTYLSQLGVADASDAWPGELSGGMAHRVALARALALKPDLLFLDEPMTGLDQAAKDNALSVLKQELSSRPVLCFYITHHCDEADVIATRTLTLGSNSSSCEC